MLLEKSREMALERMKGWAKAEIMPSVGVSGGKSKVICCNEQYCIGTWNVKSMNQGNVNLQVGDGKCEHQHLWNY